MPTTRKLFHAGTQQVETAELTVDPINGEILATFADGRFLKFPPNVTPESFTELLGNHAEANKGQVSIEGTERLVAQLGDSPSEDHT